MRRIAASPHRGNKRVEKQTLAAPAKKPARSRTLQGKTAMPDDGEWEEF
jgi:hypothetical protein